MSEPRKSGGFLGRLFGREKSASEQRTEPAAPVAGEDVSAPAGNLTETGEEISDETVTPGRAAAPATSPEPAAGNASDADAIATPPVGVPALPTPEAPAAATPSERKGGWFQRLTGGLSKTSAKLTEGISSLFTKRKLDAATLDDLEDILISADLGVATATRITDALSKGRYAQGISADDVRQVLAAEVERVLAPVARPLEIDPANTPHVILVVGVNGTGKTTTIGKLAAKLTAEGRKVMIAAGDTFRAAAIDQLKVWGERTGVPVIASAVGADSAGLAFDALKAARDGRYDVLIIDTAGRLQNKQALMDELGKVVRVLGKIDEQAPHDVLLVLDATTGQNALQQVEVFRERAGVTGLVMTKLDGTARGGILVAISEKYRIPVHAIGVGESVEDLQPFEAGEFARALVTGEIH